MTIPEHRTIYQFNFNVMVHPATKALLIDLINERMDGLRAASEEVFYTLLTKTQRCLAVCLLLKLMALRLTTF